MTRRTALRASDADREQVVERLRTAAAEGRLQADELEDRLGTAFSARTYGELDVLVSDLPGSGVGTLRARPPAPRPAPRPMVPVLFALVLLFMVVGALGSTLVGHAHAHGWSGVSIMWLVWVALGWRLFAHRHGRAR